MNLHCPDATLYTPNIGSEDKGRICWLNIMSIMSIIFMFRPEEDLRLAFNIGTKPGFSLFECFRQKIGILFVNIAVLVFLMGQNPKCPGYNY